MLRRCKQGRTDPLCSRRPGAPPEQTIHCPYRGTQNICIRIEIVERSAHRLIGDGRPVQNVSVQAIGRAASKIPDVKRTSTVLACAFCNCIHDIADGVACECRHKHACSKSGRASGVDVAKYQPVQEVRLAGPRRTENQAGPCTGKAAPGVNLRRSKRILPGLRKKWHGKIVKTRQPDFRVFGVLRCGCRIPQKERI